MNVSLKLDIKILTNTVDELKRWFKDMDVYLGKLDEMGDEGLYENYEHEYNSMDLAISHIDTAISILRKLTPIKIA